MRDEHDQRRARVIPAGDPVPTAAEVERDELRAQVDRLTKQLDLTGHELRAVTARLVAARETAKDPGASVFADYAHLSDDYAVVDRLPHRIGLRWGRWYPPHRTVIVPEIDAARAQDGEGSISEPVAEALFAAFHEVQVDGRAILRVGCRTPHDTMERPIVSGSLSGFVHAMRTSERAMVEMWAWCARYRCVPVTFHRPIDKAPEWRVRIVNAVAVAASMSMWDSVYRDEDAPAHSVESLVASGRRALRSVDAVIPRDHCGENWLDVLFASSQPWIVDENPGDGTSWPGLFHNAGEADDPRGVAVMDPAGNVSVHHGAMPDA